MIDQDNLNNPYMQGNQYGMMPAQPNVKSLLEETKKSRALYPEIHYKLQPFITSTCDAIESSGVMPTQHDLDDITDDVLNDFCNMYPDMANYMKANDNDNDPNEAVQTQIFGGGYRPDRYRGFRRRGLGRDLILSLLLAGLGGRRYPYYPYSYNPYPYY